MILVKVTQPRYSVSERIGFERTELPAEHVGEKIIGRVTSGLKNTGNR